MEAKLQIVAVLASSALLLIVFEIAITFYQMATGFRLRTF